MHWRAGASGRLTSVGSGKIAFPIYTIGHSTRSIDHFVDLLRRGSVKLVADVRSVPRSRTNPQYNEDVLPEELASFQIRYQQIAELGGLRGRSRDIPPEVNGYWRNQSFHNYADYALSPEFEAGLDRLQRLSEKQETAIMCSEAVWWRCHRRIIADYLLVRGHEVLHLMGADRVQPAIATPAAKQEGRHLVYPGA